MTAKNRENIYSWIVLAVLVLCFTTATFIHPIQQDEGVFLAIGRGIAHGNLPYRDFFDHKPPGIYFLFAALYKLFSNHLLAFQLTLIVTIALSALLVYLIAKKLGSNGLLAAIFFLWLNLVFQGNYLIAEPFMAALLVFAVFLILGQDISAEKTKKIPLFASGFFLGLAILFKQTAIISIAAIFIWLIWRKQWSRLLPIIIGFIVPLASLAWYFSFNNLWQDAWAQIVTYNFNYYPAQNIFKVIWQLLPSFLWTLPIWILAAIFTLKLFRKRVDLLSNPDNKRLVAMLAIFPIPALLLRHYQHYWLQIAPFVSIMAAGIMNQEFRIKNYKISLIVYFVAMFTAIIFICCFLSSNLQKYQDERKIEKFLEQKNQTFYSENQFIGFYFLADKNPPSRYLYLTEIDDWSEQAEDKTLDTIKNSQPLIVWPADSNYAYAKDLQSYIFANYKPVFWQHDLSVVVYQPEKDN